jgi:hypothetical protein
MSLRTSSWPRGRHKSQIPRYMCTHSCNQGSDWIGPRLPRALCCQTQYSVLVLSPSTYTYKKCPVTSGINTVTHILTAAEGLLSSPQPNQVTYPLDVEVSINKQYRQKLEQPSFQSKPSEAMVTSSTKVSSASFNNFVLWLIKLVREHPQC